MNASNPELSATYPPELAPPFVTFPTTVARPVACKAYASSYPACQQQRLLCALPHGSVPLLVLVDIRHYIERLFFFERTYCHHQVVQVFNVYIYRS